MTIGLDFIWPTIVAKDRAEFDKISLALVAPQPYIAENPLSKHMQNAVFPAVLDLTLRKHINLKSGKEFNCFSYYADDPYIVAFCAEHDNVYLATISTPFVRRLVKICSRIGLVLHLWRQTRGRPEPPEQTSPNLEQDDSLTKLLEGSQEVSDSEAQDIVTHWPDADTESAQLELGEYALFYDLIRLIWLHEWAHALCGHVAFASGELHIAQLHEFSAERVGEQLVDRLGYPRNEVLQALELHADEFAVQYCVRQILWGSDPIGGIAGPQIDLVTRLLIFNTACCVFAVMWSLAEQQYSPGTSFYPSREVLMSDKRDPMFVAFKTTHPPTALRYYRFRNFQQDLAWEYGQENDPSLPGYVDASSFWFLDKLGKVSKHFNAIVVETPGLVKTPTMKRLEAYETHLLTMGAKVKPLLQEMGFVPTVDPLAEPS